MLIDSCLCLCLGLGFFFFFLVMKLGWIVLPWNRPRSGWTGPTGLAETRQAGFGVKKKTRLLNMPGPGNRGRPTGWVLVSKNLARTRPVAIPTVKFPEVVGFWQRNIGFNYVCFI